MEEGVILLSTSLQAAWQPEDDDELIGLESEPREHRAPSPELAAHLFTADGAGPDRSEAGGPSVLPLPTRHQVQSDQLLKE